MNKRTDISRKIREDCADQYSSVEDILLSAPRPGLFDEQWIDECAELMRNRFSGQMRYVKDLADLALEGTFEGKDTKLPEELHHRYSRPLSTKKRRGRLAGIFARLWRVFGDRRYLSACKDELFRLIRALPHMPDSDPAPYAPWHPGYKGTVDYELGHIAENAVMLIPFVRTEFTEKEAFEILDFLWKAADFCYRNARTDIVFNITFHMLEPLLLIAAGYPEFRDSALWERTAVERLTHLFAGRRGMSRDGYFKEGFSYQQVNHNLMMRSYLALKRSGKDVPQPVEQAVRSSMEFSARIIRNDGHVPRIGDGAGSGYWEHDIEHHEFLHLAAAVLNRPDLIERASTRSETSPAELVIWLMGKEGFRNWERMNVPHPEEKEQSSFDLHYSGFQVCGAGRGENAHYGILNYSTSHNHAHHDALSIDIAGFGRPLIADPGTYRYESFDREERFHSLCRFLRLGRFGPRLEGYDHTGTLYAEYGGEHIKSCGAFHTLYEGHITTRTLTLVMLGGGTGGNEDIPAFWVVMDTLSRSRPPFSGEDECEIYELIETYFTFNAPGSRIGMDEESLTCWSRYDPDQTDVETVNHQNLEHGDGRKANKKEINRIFDYTDSDANIQITGFFPERESADIHETVSFTCQYRERTPVPCAGFRWRYGLPHRACYVLVPFRGVRDEMFCRVEGELHEDGFTARVYLPGMPPATFSSTRIDGKEGEISVEAGAMQECIRVRKKNMYESRI